MLSYSHLHKAANYKQTITAMIIVFTGAWLIALPRSRHLGYVTVASAGMTHSSDVVTSGHSVNR